MNSRTYLIPGPKDRTFKTSDAGYGLRPADDGSGVVVTADMLAAEIAERARRVVGAVMYGGI